MFIKRIEETMSCSKDSKDYMKFYQNMLKCSEDKHNGQLGP
jgi:hypothetical protein